MSSEVIREYLVSLGYHVDGTSERRFTESMAGAAKDVAALGAAMAAAAPAFVAGVAKIAGGMEQLYFAAQRTHAAVGSIQDLQYAATQMGASAEGAAGSLESLARFMRENPNGENFVRSLGVSTRDANGQLRDTTQIMGDLGKRLAAMPYYRARQYGSMFGFDERTLMALRSGMGQFTDQYQQMLRVAGLNSTQAANASHGFMVQLREVAAWLQILSQRVYTDLAQGIGDDIERFRVRFIADFGKISHIIESVVKGILWAADIVTSFGMVVADAIEGVIGWFRGLDDRSKRVVEAIGAIAAAWLALDAAMDANPITLALALGAAILALWDDYRVWKEGGKSLIDWGRWKWEIQLAKDGIDGLTKSINTLISRVEYLFNKSKMIAGGALDKLEQFAGIKPDPKTGKYHANPVASMAAAMGLAQFGPQLASAHKLNPLTGMLAMFGLNSFGPKVMDDLLNIGRHITGQQYEHGRPGAEAPRGIRNNNPGNIRYGEFARRHGAVGQDSGGFAIFNSPSDGLSALSANISAYAKRGIDSVQAFVNRYAPPSDGNDTGAYQADMAKRLGVGIGDHIDLNNAATRLAMMNAVTLHENGRQPYSQELMRTAAGATLNQQTTININGVSNPHEAGNEVAGRQQVVNERAARNLTPGRAT